MKLKISLDLDDTVLCWKSIHEKTFNCKVNKRNSEKIESQVESLKENREFWSNLPLLEKPDFIPYCYATKRINSKIFTVESLKKNNLPIRPIYQFYNQSDNKATLLKGKADVLIDDSWFNVMQCLQSGFPALLITRPHNKWIKTKYRITHLKYQEIENKYVELFQ